MKKKVLMLLVMLFLSINGQASEALDPVAKKICQGICSGTMAWVQAWNDGAGLAKVYQYQGSLETCSHPPQLFYQSDGIELGSFPEFPVDRQDPASMARLKELQAKREGWLKGLVAGEKVWCRSPQSH